MSVFSVKKNSSKIYLNKELTDGEKLAALRQVLPRFLEGAMGTSSLTRFKNRIQDFDGFIGLLARDVLALTKNNGKAALVDKMTAMMEHRICDVEGRDSIRNIAGSVTTDEHTEARWDNHRIGKKFYGVTFAQDHER